MGFEVGYRDQSIRARKRLKEGAAISNVVLAMEGKLCSFVRSFIASAKG